MNRRSFLQNAGAAGLTLACSGLQPLRLHAAGAEQRPGNPNWVNPRLGANVKASSYYPDPPWGYAPPNIFGENLFTGWQADEQERGAWLEIDFPELRTIRELWILTRPRPRDILGQAVYMLAYSRSSLYAPPRQIECTVSSGMALPAALRDADYFQVLTFPQPQRTASLRVQVRDVWTRAGTRETGIAKLRAFSLPHEPDFEIDAYAMYDVHSGRPVQAATLRLVNPGDAIPDAQLVISQSGPISLGPIPARSVTRQDIWIPAPFTDTVMDFTIRAAARAWGRTRSLHVPAYRSYFDGGIFALNCTCHNDLGWLNTQEKTADFRSARIILPALDLLSKYPEFRYSMESTVYLMEFLKRHPERRLEMMRRMQEQRFTWGASYVQCQEAHVGPEKLARQFYFGRRWLKETFPGVDTHFYVKTDPPEMTWQMPQILRRAGIKYAIQGRMPYGFYRWEAPDGSFVLTYAYHYVDPMRLLDPKGNHGWLSYAAERSAYYRSHDLPRMFIYDYTSDYLPPQPALPPYARNQNRAMKQFADYWNHHASSRIHPPQIVFVTPEGFLDEFTKHPLDITTLKGDWPFSWAYYDEPSNREALLAGREAHNRLLTAERIFGGLSLSEGFPEYPQEKFRAAWQANCWPDHGWGGNQGVITDSVYAASYDKSKRLADELLHEAGARLAKAAVNARARQTPIVVFNPLSWERTDLVELSAPEISSHAAFTVCDEAGKEVPCDISSDHSSSLRLAFVAQAVPPLGYRTYFLQPASTAPPTTGLGGRVAENSSFKLIFGDGGLKSLYGKRLRWEVLRTGKFDGGEVIQLTAPGMAWEDPEIVTMENFERTSHFPFPFRKFVRTPVRTTAVREAQFTHFTLRESFHLYHELSRVDIEVELADWDGQKERELRIAFPVNLDQARLCYEVPFGKVEMGKDELDFTLLPPDRDTAFRPDLYGGDHPLAYREAINWIDASSRDYLGRGLLSASDMTVHLFRDETANPVTYPVLQHVLLSTRRSLAWNPEYWFTQKGTHRYRMSLMPHEDDWRQRYRDAIGFNYPLVAVLAEGSGSNRHNPNSENHPRTGSFEFFRLEPANLVLTALKKSEDDHRIVVRFYEAEGFKTPAQISLAKPIRRAWRASLIEYDEDQLPVSAGGSLEFTVGPWEIVTLKVEV